MNVKEELVDADCRYGAKKNKSTQRFEVYNNSKFLKKNASKENLP